LLQQFKIACGHFIGEYGRTPQNPPKIVFNDDFWPFPADYLTMASIEVKCPRMHRDIASVIIPQEKIAKRVRELASQIMADHTAKAGESEITIIPILTGAMIFCGDLIRQIPIAMKIGLMTVSSYPGHSIRSQGAQFLASKLGNLHDRHVVVVDDVLDSGGTLGVVLPILREMGAASVKSCVLLRKDRPAARSVAVDYVGFEIPDVFVVGYGLDYNDYYRNLPDVVTLTPQALAHSKL
jgi:hypoxanthine phosphoribosyltransferase